MPTEKLRRTQTKKRPKGSNSLTRGLVFLRFALFTTFQSAEPSQLSLGPLFLLQLELKILPSCRKQMMTQTSGDDSRKKTRRNDTDGENFFGHENKNYMRTDKR